MSEKRSGADAEGPRLEGVARRPDGLTIWREMWRSLRGRRGEHSDAVPEVVAVSVLSPAMFAAVAAVAPGATVLGGAVVGVLFALLASFHALATRVEGWAGEAVVDEP